MVCSWEEWETESEPLFYRFTAVRRQPLDALMPLALILFLLLTLIAAPGPAQAFGEPGHRIVGELAEHQLRPAARAEVNRLLAGEPEPSLAGVANWADEVRAANHGGGRTKRWHFVNFKGGDCSYVPARDCPDGNCVIAAINGNFLALADRKRSDDERREALKFLVHLVGDVHQPLHATPLDDHGGGDFQVGYHGKGRNLHGVWDTLILQARGLPPPAYAALLEQQPPLPADPTRRSDRPAVDWAVESCLIVRDGNIYPTKHLVDDNYVSAHRALLEQRLRRAGSRLADMLNYALDPRLAKSR
jgi:nuclease S1